MRTTVATTRGSCRSRGSTTSRTSSTSSSLSGCGRNEPEAHLPLAKGDAATEVSQSRYDRIVFRDVEEADRAERAQRSEELARRLVVAGGLHQDDAAVRRRAVDGGACLRAQAAQIVV